MTNKEKIQSLSTEELKLFIEMLQCDYDSSGYIGCYHCSAYGTHHSDRSNIGTEYEYLYECKDCEFENGLESWLESDVDAEAGYWKRLNSLLNNESE